MTAIPEKKARISFKLNHEHDTIELYDEFLIDEKIKNTACIPYLEHVHKVIKSTDSLQQIVKPTQRNIQNHIPQVHGAPVRDR